MGNDNELNSMNEVMDQIDSSMKNVRSGEVVKGKVISVTDEQAMVNIGYIVDGVLPKSELCKDENVNVDEVLKVGDEIYVYVIKTNDEDGNVLLSKIKADREICWDRLTEVLKDDKAFEIVVKQVVKGGVIADLYGLRAFIPASQLSVKYVSDLNEFLGKTLLVKIIELDKSKSRIVLSRKEVEKLEFEKKKEKLWSSISKGDKVKGVVSRLTGFGAFIDLGGVEGLAHISELSWRRIKNPSEVVSVGDCVEVYVLNADKDKNRISLSLKNTKKNPWDNMDEKYNVNDIIEGTVSKIINIGAFVEIEPGVEGLVHISEISEEHIAKPSDVLKVGDRVKVKILDINTKDSRISLSIKDAVDKPKDNFKQYLDEDESGVTLGDLLKDKLKNIKFE
ncbi:30S ribosomal protein S1 [Clostridium autoethanogenum]|uniref:30S ribosomal protein S1 n=1 Tax=Clostridium autoethanogenum DSM 10061 TaxID=1341692 RepID=A0ABM5NRY5_9CLOT|nr:30S ribosomal protein S1 [Clostridium autoethanogenum]AGY75075.1 30S ribosomal protein S1 [Clostridium autoethanogenum DSM 10061]ALU35248.1 RNA binding S1 domain protein [Clostridium autoethanogenum DSM 10061]OVY49673.1 30S ribosomal protein S1 [Clostridium autoethanogenum]